MSAGSRFYTPGGTLPPDALSYIERSADKELLDGLLNGHFCYVLTSRQMGKSSLMIHTALALRRESATAAALDLTAIGADITPSQWYRGLLDQLGARLDLEDEMDGYWAAKQEFSPLHRFMGAIRDVALVTFPGRLVIFIDEIDIVRGLPFSTDEFFAAIRECYNRRAVDPQMNRLTFCLLGVATPADLIRDARLTPFNIGKRIDLADFTLDEAQFLRHGFNPPGNTQSPDAQDKVRAVLLERVYYWTGGHPYLTQRLCEAVAHSPGPAAPSTVDAICSKLFFVPGARSGESYLAFVANQALHGDADPTAVLALYSRVLKCRQVAIDPANPVQGALKLAGLAHPRQGRLQRRNRIYSRVFDRRWIAHSLPDQTRRVRIAAMREGFLRAGIPAAAVVLLTSTLTVYSLRMRSTADQANAKLDAINYAYGVETAQKFLDDGNVPMAVSRLERCRSAAGGKEPRGFEWRYLWGRCQQDNAVLRTDAFEGHCLAVSPDGRYLAAGGQSYSGSPYTVLMWDLKHSGAPLAIPYPGEVNSLAFSPDGRTLALGGGTPYDVSRPSQVRFWSVSAGRFLSKTMPTNSNITSVAYSPNGRWLAVCDQSKGVIGSEQILDLRTGRLVFPARGSAKSDDYRHNAVFSPDSATLVLGRGPNAAVMKLGAAGAAWTTTIANSSSLCGVFSPRGDLYAEPRSPSGQVRIWDART
ncbi:MAG TPA: AAA-like domain-containing protein, partial [Chthonomonadales bacterium]|nr:AAA-like domain-containing protein [Chthonomonadales bacterium]